MIKKYLPDKTWKLVKYSILILLLACRNSVRWNFIKKLMHGLFALPYQFPMVWSMTTRSKWDNHIPIDETDINTFLSSSNHKP